MNQLQQIAEALELLRSQTAGHSRVVSVLNVVVVDQLNVGAVDLLFFRKIRRLGLRKELHKSQCADKETVFFHAVLVATAAPTAFCSGRRGRPFPDREDVAFVKATGIAFEFHGRIVHELPFVGLDRGTGTQPQEENSAKQQLPRLHNASVLREALFENSK